MKAPMYAVVDIETTGTDPKKDRIIQFGCVFIQQDQIVSQVAMDINPGGVIPKQIQMLTGITNKQVAKSPYFEDVAATISQLLSDCIFIAHNIHFDLNFLNAEIVRCGYPALKLKGIDTVELAQIFLPTALSYRLSDLAKELDFTHENPHQADSDAYVTACLFIEITRRMRQLPLTTLEKIAQLANLCTMETGQYIQEVLAEKKQELPPLDPKWVVVKGLALKKQTVPLFAEKQQATPRYPQNKRQKSRLYGERLEYRSEQAKMMNATYQFFTEKEKQKENLFIEAEMGLGKTIGYLLPLSYLATPENPAVISTTSIVLEEQLIYQDIPLLNQILPQKIYPVLLKSHRYYLDLESFWRTLEQKQHNQQYQFYQMSVLVWLTMTTTGDLTELKQSNLNHAFWDDVRHLGLAFLDPKSAFYDWDFLRKREAEKQQANLLITNHAYLCHEEYRTSYALPASSFLVIDEAHHFPEVAEKVGSGQLDIKKWQQQFQQNADAPAVMATKQTLQKEPENRRLYYLFETLLSEMTDNLLDLQAFFWRQFPFGGAHAESNEFMLTKAWFQMLPKADQQLFQELALQSGELLEVTELLEKKIQQIWQTVASGMRKNLRQFLLKLTDLQNKVRFYRRYFVDWNPQAVRWLQHYGQRGMTLVGSDFESAFLPDKAWFKRYPQVLFTGGTLKAGHQRNFFPQRLGLENYDFKALKSPFDYGRQGRLYVCEDFPALKETTVEEYAKHVAWFIRDLMQQSDKPFLVLFSSLEMIQAVYHKLHIHALNTGRELLAQGISGSNFKILKRFRTSENAILLGADSFWEGIDLPGEALEIVIVARLPFASPNRPLEAARKNYFAAQGQSSFYQYDLPQAGIRLKQGFGRLIRSQYDQGVMIVLDKRLMTASYSKKLQQALPKNLPVALLGKQALLAEMAEFLKGE